MKKTLLLSAFALASATAFAALPFSKSNVVKPGEFTQAPHENSVATRAAWDFIYNPEGTEKTLCGHYTFFQAETPVIDQLDPGTFVYGENNEVYVQNPVSGYRTGAYLKGTLEGNRIKIELPQAVGIFWGDVILCQKLGRNSRGDFYVMHDDNVIYYDIHENGDIELALGNTLENIDQARTFIGLTYEDNSFASHADSYQYFTSYDFQKVEMPEGLSFIPYKLTDRYYPEGFACYLATQGEDCYLKGIFPDYPDYFVKGKVEGNRLVFDTPQYQGIFPKPKSFVWILGATEDGQILDSFSITCSEDRQVLTTDDDEFIFLSNDYRELNYMDFLVYPTFEMQTQAEMDAVPQPPRVGLYMPYQPPMHPEGGIQWLASPINENNFAYDLSRVYYRAWLDGEPVEAEVDGEMSTVIPLFTHYITDDYELVGYYNAVEIFFNKDFKTYGFEYLYYGSDMRIYSSGAYQIDQDTLLSVETNDWTDEVVGVTYYDLSGREVANPEAGIYVKRVKHASGRVSSEKTIVK